MLFFFGTGTTIINTQRLEGLACHHCGTSNSLLLTIYSRYLHFFWIPVIPLGKQSITQCTHCQQVLRDGEMPPTYAQLANLGKQQARLPVSNYLVLSVLGVLFVGLMVLGALSDPVKKPAPEEQQDSEVEASTPAEPADASSEEDDTSQNAAFMATPQVDDLYVLRFDDGKRMVRRVVRVDPDSLYFRDSAYLIDSATEAFAQQDSLRKHESPNTTVFARTTLQNINEAGVLSIVRR